MIESGVATGFAQLVQLNPVGGDQTYVAAPVACKVLPVPWQISVSAPAFTFGIGKACTLARTVSLQPVLFVTNKLTVYVPATVYVCAGGFMSEDVLPFPKSHCQLIAEVSATAREPLKVMVTGVQPSAD